MVDDAALRRLAWHDVTCPESEGCRDRLLHATGGFPESLLEQYHHRLEELREVMVFSDDGPQLRLV